MHKEVNWTELATGEGERLHAALICMCPRAQRPPSQTTRAAPGYRYKKKSHNCRVLARSLAP